MPTHTDSDGQPIALSRKQAAAAMGVHPSTIDKWRQAGHLRWIKVDGKVLIPRIALEELIAAGAEQ